MKKFLFVIPQSPKRIISPFRQRLIDVSMRSLLAQTSNEWEALLLGEEEKTEGNCRFINSPFPTKEEKLHYVVDQLLAEKNKPEYIIRFDDDDLIHPQLLERISTLQFDCYADEWHTFYDVSSGKLSSQKRNWLANTIIHKTEHALAQYGEYHYVVKSDLRRPHLLQNDHSKWWHNYYKGKNIVFAPQSDPMYLRVLSPTSFTAGSGELNKDEYSVYLNQFGDWNEPIPAAFCTYTDELHEGWKATYGAPWEIDTSSKNTLRSRIGKMFGR